MKKLIIGTALTALASTMAVAADLPSKKNANAAPIALARSWTGFYVGANVGAGMNKNAVDYSLVDAFYTSLTITRANGPSNISSTKTSFSGGVDLGYNQQIDNMVVGIEADLSNLKRSNASSSANYKTNVNGVPCFTTNCFWSNNPTSGSDWLATARLRAGYAVDKLLIFASGGLAVGTVKVSSTMNYRDVPSAGVGIDGIYANASNSATKVGWAMGGGLEYALNAQFSLKAEYLHYNLGSVSANYVATPLALELPGFPRNLGTVKATASGDLIRAGLNYRF